MHLAWLAAACTRLDSAAPEVDPMAPVGVVGSIHALDQVFLRVWGEASMPFVGSDDPCPPGDGRVLVFDTATGQAVRSVVVPEHDVGPGGMIGFGEGPPWITVVLEEEIVVELTPEGDEIRRMEVPFEALHHEIRADAPGAFTALFQETVGRTILDGLTTWSSEQQVDGWFWADHAAYPEVEGEWTHTNAFDRDPDGAGGFLLSLWRLDTIVHVGADGRIEWAMHGDEPVAEVGPDLTLDWGGEQDASFAEQHSVRYDAAGRVQFLDNSHGRVLVWRIDAEAGVAHLERVFPALHPEGEWCQPPHGTAEPVDGGVVVACRSGGWIGEYTDDGTLRWAGQAVCPNRDAVPDTYTWQPLFDPGWAPR